MRLSMCSVDSASLRLRNIGVRVSSGEVLISKLSGTIQEKDLTAPPNCDGYGRLRHFRRSTNPNWPQNGLPLDPACKRLGLSRTDFLVAQAFQNAICNWRCWYCYVPFELLAGKPKHSSWMTANQLLDLCLRDCELPLVIDLTGGQPDLTPEWILWMIDAIDERNLSSSIYLWSDDNLSSDFFWRFLTDDQICRLSSYRNYGKVCCFKGFDQDSFSFNTGTRGVPMRTQFDLMNRVLDTGIDVYAYVTLTSPSIESLQDRMSVFVDRLQDLDEFLPLRTVPLEIRQFTPVESRMNERTTTAIKNQYAAVQAWTDELAKRFSESALSHSISDVKLARHST